MTNPRPTIDPRSRAFRPPNCPNIHCPHYFPSPDWNPSLDGFFRRPSDGCVFQRFRCRHCRRRFSSRTFTPDYWLRRRDLLHSIAQLSTEGPGLRQIARLLRVSHATVMRHLARAGRHCLLLHRQILTDCPTHEPLVIDGFESFEFSQFFPFHFNLAVGAQSWTIFHFTDSPLRRKGTMTPQQRSRREYLEARLGRPDPKAVENGVFDLLLPLCRAPSLPTTSPMVLHSDDHPAYRRALHRLATMPGSPVFQHRVTSSTERRTPHNPLFPVNLTDLLLRHGQANHRRETIAFSKRRQAAIERLAVFTVWRNAIKSRREKLPGETAAMAAGLLDRPWSWTRVFRTRKFPRREDLPGLWWSYYWRRIKTAALGSGQSEHRLKYAF
jgi:transposase-like protein